MPVFTHRQNRIAAAGSAVVIGVGAVAALALTGAASASAASVGGPCDILAKAKTPCVAAYSSVRALYKNYDGALYLVQRTSDRKTKKITVTHRGGYAHAAAQNKFCAKTRCNIVRIYDQSKEHNDLTVSGGGSAAPKPDSPARAGALPVVVNGHHVYGVALPAGVGYRNTHTKGIATNGKPESMYEVADGKRTNARCCSDFGNVEKNVHDNGKGHMDALNLSSFASRHPSNGPWVQADLENGVFRNGPGPNRHVGPNRSMFVTALLKNNGQTAFALKSADAQRGKLVTRYSGPLPKPYVHNMHQEGAIVLGTGGDNSNWGNGAFFEGVMTSGYTSSASDNAVEANIVAAHYK